MKTLKILCYGDVVKVSDYAGDDFVVDLEDCAIGEKKRVIDFLAGLTFLNGALEKRNKNQFIVREI